MTTITTSASFAPAGPAPARRARGRIAWFIPGIVLALAAIGLTTADVVSAFAFAREHFTTQVTQPVDTLEVHADAGSVHVVAATSLTTGATVTGKGTRGLITPRHHVTIENGRLVVSTGCRNGLDSFCHMDLTVTVPPTTALDLSASGGGVTVDGAFGAVHASSSGGGVHVRGATGPLSLHSSGGGVSAERVSSSTVDATSSGGGVRVEFTTPPETVHASSSGGHVTVTVPETTDVYLVHASSSGGSTHTNIRTDPNSSRVIEAHSSGGGVTVQYPQP